MFTRAIFICRPATSLQAYLCCHRHHGCYDQGYIFRTELLQAEEVWIRKTQRPEPYPPDTAFLKRVSDGEVSRHCVWRENCAMRYATASMFAEGNPAVIRPPMSQLMWWFSLLTQIGRSYTGSTETFQRRSRSNPVLRSRSPTGRDWPTAHAGGIVFPPSNESQPP
jgi:hypothetical protein